METVIGYDGKRKKVNPYAVGRKALRAAPLTLLLFGVVCCYLYAFTTDGFWQEEDPSSVYLAVGLIVVISGIIGGGAIIFFALQFLFNGYEALDDYLRDRERKWKDVSD